MLSASGILGTNFAAVTSALDGLAMRQRVHAENLANVNTPGYQARTVNFEHQLNSMLASDPSNRRANQLPGSMPMLANGATMPNLLGDTATGGLGVQKPAGFHASDRSSRGVERTTETNAMMQDMVRFRVLTQHVTNRLSQIRGVVSEMGRM